MRSAELSFLVKYKKRALKLLKIGYYCYYDVTASEISVASNYVSIILLQLFTSAFIKIYIREKKEII